MTEAIRSIVHYSSDGMQELNSARWRVNNQADALKKAGYDASVLSVQHWLSQTSKGRLACAQADVIVIHRVLTAESIEFTKYWINQGKTVICDFDDSYDHVLPTNPAHRFWQEGIVTIHGSNGVVYDKPLEYRPIDKFREGLGVVSGATMPSRVLVSDWTPYGNCYYLPNYVDSGRYTSIQKRENDYILIGYGSSLGHLQSHADSGVAEALRKICKERKDVRLFLVGDRRAIDVLNMPRESLVFTDYISYDKWAGNKLSFYDIGIAPLYGEFDMRRSFIKVIEYLLCRIPYIVTSDPKYPVYQDFSDVDSGFSIPSELTVSDKAARISAWYVAFNEMIDNLAEFKKRAERNVEIAMQYDVDRNVGNIIGVYEKIAGLL